MIEVIEPQQVGVDLLGGAIYGAGPYSDEQALADKSAARFAGTPVYHEVPQGRTLHVGGGIFLRRCPRCPAFVRSYGGILHVPILDRHLREEHEIETGPLLPPPPGDDDGRSECLPS